MSIDPQFIVSLRGKSFPLYAGALDAATKAGLRSLRTTVLQIPSSENGHLGAGAGKRGFSSGQERRRKHGVQQPRVGQAADQGPARREPALLRPAAVPVVPEAVHPDRLLRGKVVKSVLWRQAEACGVIY